MKVFEAKTWGRAALLALPVLALQAPVSQLQTELGFQPFSSAVAQEEKKKDTRQTRRTPNHQDGFQSQLFLFPQRDLITNRSQKVAHQSLQVLQTQLMDYILLLRRAHL